MGDSSISRGSGSSPSAADICFQLELPSDLRIVEETVAYLARCCSRHDFTGKRLSLNFRVGLTEALANAILYGNKRDLTKRVRVSVVLNDSQVLVEVSDEGNGFDPHGVPDPTLPENLERPGGRGVFLIRQLMDEVEYLNRGSSVRLVLYRQSPTRYPAGA
jgi:serine/threonine-protein kinase RsbW